MERMQVSGRAPRAIPRAPRAPRARARTPSNAPRGPARPHRRERGRGRDRADRGIARNPESCGPQSLPELDDAAPDPGAGRALVRAHARRDLVEAELLEVAERERRPVRVLE